MGWIGDEIPKAELRADRKKDYNKRQKSLMKIVGENLAAYALLLIIVLMVGFIWTDIGFFVSLQRFIGDAAITVVLYILADLCASYLGARGGKADEDYIAVRKEYVDLKEQVIKAGITLMDIFCDWQIGVEFEMYVRKRCREIEVDYDTYMSEYRLMEASEIRKRMPRLQAEKVILLNQAKRIELTSEMLMTEGRVKSTRGGIPISGEEYIEKHTTGWQHIVVTTLFAIVAAVPTFALAQEVSLAMIMYTVFKICLLCYRMYAGFSRGAKGYNTVEPKNLAAKNRYLYLYLEFLNDKIYLQLRDRYDILLTEEDNNEHINSDSGSRRIEAEHGIGRAEDAVGTRA